MPDAPPPLWAQSASDDHRAAPSLTPERIDAILADFRRWLEDLRDTPREVPGEPPQPVDLATIVAQFTALRHEVNLQTRATRTAVEQTSEALKLLSPPKPPDTTEVVRPLVKVLIDIADALTAAHRQTTKARETSEQLLAQLTVPPPPPRRRGFLASLFGSAPDVAAAAGIEEANLAAEKLRPVLAGLADGYTLSLRRIERAIPLFGLEPIEVLGQPFDPELMEVVEVVETADHASGSVVEEVRRGYRWNGKPFRFAQVKVAR